MVAVTGAGGFIGSHLASALRGVTVRPAGREPARLPEAFTGAHAVVHLAARVHVMRETERDPAASYQRDNVELTEAVVKAAAAAGVRVLVLASSVKAVGERGIMNADTEPAPLDPYGRSKLESERVAIRLGAAAGMRIVILRLPLVYGPSMKGNMLRLFDLVWRGVPLPLGAVRNQRSIVYVGNVAAAIAGVIDNESAGPQPLFVSDAEPLSTPGLVRAIARALGTQARLIPVPPVLLRAAGLVGASAAIDRLLGSLLVDAAPLARIIGPPPFSTDAGLHATAEWFLGRAA